MAEVIYQSSALLHWRACGAQNVPAYIGDDGLDLGALKQKVLDVLDLFLCERSRGVYERRNRKDADGKVVENTMMLEVKRSVFREAARAGLLVKSGKAYVYKDAADNYVALVPNAALRSIAVTDCFGQLTSIHELKSTRVLLAAAKWLCLGFGISKSTIESAAGVCLLSKTLLK